MTDTQPAGTPAPCRAQYPYLGRLDRIVECHLERGHPGEHEEADTEFTWTDPADAPEPDAEHCGVEPADLHHLQDGVAPAPPAAPEPDSGPGWDRASIEGSARYLGYECDTDAEAEVLALLADRDRMRDERRTLAMRCVEMERQRAEDREFIDTVADERDAARAELAEVTADRDRLADEVTTWKTRLVDETAGLRGRLDATPATYTLLAEPPPEVTELWDRHGRRWERHEALGRVRWRRIFGDGSLIIRTWPELLAAGPLSTVPPEPATSSEGERDAR